MKGDLEISELWQDNTFMTGIRQSSSHKSGSNHVTLQAGINKECEPIITHRSRSWVVPILAESNMDHISEPMQFIG
jgi:hypothetical protein